MVYRDFLITARLKWKFIELVYLPITTVLIWGLFAVYARSFSAEAGALLLVINVFWAFAHLTQSTTNQNMMEDVWSGSLKQLFFSGITEFEYLFSRIISTTIITCVVAALMLGLSFYFGITAIAANISAFVAFSVIILIASISLSILVASLIFVMGREYGFLSWAAIQIFILLSAPFFPVEIFPTALQYVAQIMPFTDVFTAIRLLIETGVLHTDLMAKGTIISAAYFFISLPLYKMAFKRAKKTGKLVRMS